MTNNYTHLPTKSENLDSPTEDKNEAYTYNDADTASSMTEEEYSASSLLRPSESLNISPDTDTETETTHRQKEPFWDRALNFTGLRNSKRQSPGFFTYTSSSAWRRARNINIFLYIILSIFAVWYALFTFLAILTNPY